MTIRFSTRFLEPEGVDIFSEGGGGLVQDDPPYSTLTLESFLGRTWLKAHVVDPTYPSDPSTDCKCRAEVSRSDNYPGSGSFREDDSDLYYGLRTYLPSDFYTIYGTDCWPQGCCLFQLKEHGTWGVAFYVQYSNQEVRWKYRKYDYSISEFVTTTYEYYDLIRGRPFTHIYHLNCVEDGQFELWYDGDKIVDDSGDYRMCPTDVADGYANHRFKCGLYTGLNQNAKYVYHTDIVIATTKSDVDDFLGEAQATVGGGSATMGRAITLLL